MGEFEPITSQEQLDEIISSRLKRDREATAKKAHDYRVVFWGMHGVFAMGNDLDEAFGLVETVEKASQIYFLTLGHVRQSITDEQLKRLAAAFKVDYKKII